MDDLKTALGECLALHGKAVPQGRWRFVPWHVEEDNAAVRAPDGHLICQTASDATAEAIAALHNLFHDHGEELLACVRDAEPCAWSHDFDSEAWDTACGKKWCFIEGGPEDNSVRYCHGCGNPIRIIPDAGKEGDDGR
jgi:hypothetical protein